MWVRKCLGSEHQLKEWRLYMYATRILYMHYQVPIDNCLYMVWLPRLVLLHKNSKTKHHFTQRYSSNSICNSWIIQVNRYIILIGELLLYKNCLLLARSMELHVPPFSIWIHPLYSLVKRRLPHCCWEIFWVTFFHDGVVTFESQCSQMKFPMI